MRSKLDNITPEDVRRVIAQVQGVLDREDRPLYLLDIFFRIWECNRLTLQMIGKSEGFRDIVFGKIQTFDLILDPQYGIRNSIDPSCLDDLLKQQLTRVILLLSLRFGPESVAETLDPIVERHPELQRIYPTIDLTTPRIRLGRSNVTFVRGEHRLNFDIIPDPLVTDDRFFLVEYHPSDLATSTILEYWRRQILGAQSISLAAVSKALRSWSNLTELAKDPLLSLSSLHSASQGAATKTQAGALQHLLTQCIERLAPKSTDPIRSKPLLKYEILRMMAYEGATEDQIMWDLGFEPDSDFWAQQNPDKARTPRFPYTGKGDYSATSRASFKRLKAQAIEDVRWRLEEMEKAAQD